MVTARKASGVSPSARNWKCVPQGNRQADAGRGVDDAFLFAGAPPNPPAPRKDPPNLLNAAMRDGARDRARRQLEMRETAAGERQQQAHARAVGRDGVGLVAEGLGLEVAHRRRLRSVAEVLRAQRRARKLGVAPRRQRLCASPSACYDKRDGRLARPHPRTDARRISRRGRAARGAFRPLLGTAFADFPAEDVRLSGAGAHRALVPRAGEGRRAPPSAKSTSSPRRRSAGSYPATRPRAGSPPKRSSSSARRASSRSGAASPSSRARGC